MNEWKKEHKGVYGIEDGRFPATYCRYENEELVAEITALRDNQGKPKSWKLKKARVEGDYVYPTLKEAKEADDKLTKLMNM